MDGDASMNQPLDQVPDGQMPTGQVPNGQMPNGPIQSGQAPLEQQQLGFNRPAADPFLAWFAQQQQAYVSEMFRQQQEVLQRQQAAMEQQQRAFMEQQEQVLRNVMTRINVQVPPNPEIILDSLANNIKEFRFDPGNITFEAWYKRYDELFEKDASRLDEEAKVRLLIRKLGIPEHERYTSYIMPKTAKDFSFKETVAKLTSLFGTTESVISRRYRCLQIVKQPLEDYVTYACRINKSCVEFELPKLTEEQFKCLVFVCGLKSEKDAEVRTRLLCRIEERSDITLEQISEECQRLLNIRHDTAMIEEQVAAVKALDLEQRSAKKPSKCGWNGERAKPGSKRSGPDIICWLCGGSHYARDCSFKTHECDDCGRIGHKEGYCRSAERVRKKNNNVSTMVVTVNACSVVDRRKYVPVVMNRTSVRLQLDTGSDITIISTAAWRSIGSPPMSTTTVVAIAATGKPLEIDGEFCCEMVIGGRISSGLVRVTSQPLNLLGSDTIDSFGLWSVPLDTICHLVDTSTTTINTLKVQIPLFISVSLGLRPGKLSVLRCVDEVDDELDGLEGSDRLAPSVKPAPETFCQVIVGMLSGLVRNCGYLDDVVVGGLDEADHMEKLRAVLQHVEEFDFTIRPENFSFGQAERCEGTFKREVKKSQAGRNTIDELLDVFLMTNQTTQNRQVVGGVSEAMLGWRKRTSLEKHLLPPPKPPNDPAEQKCGSRKSHDLVYAKLYSGNKWHWAAGVVCDRVGRVYTVWVENRRLIRSHDNQLLNRADWDPGAHGADASRFPVDNLLESRNLAKTTPSEDTTTLMVPDASQLTGSPGQLSAPGVSSPSPSYSGTSSSIPRSPEQVPPTGREPASLVPEPCRSSRVRRQPQRLTPYQLN